MTATDRERAEKAAEAVDERLHGCAAPARTAIIAGIITAEFAAVRREALEQAAQRCRYYAKHQNFERDLETGELSEYAKGVEITCDNLSGIFEDEADAIRALIGAQEGK
jgi:hypothetical protein